MIPTEDYELHEGPDQLKCDLAMETPRNEEDFDEDAARIDEEGR